MYRTNRTHPVAKSTVGFRLVTSELESKTWNSMVGEISNFYDISNLHYDK